MAGPIDALPESTKAFYRQGLAALEASGVPFMVGGAFAFYVYTGIARNTKDLDLFVRATDLDAAAAALASEGFPVKTEVLHWLSKAFIVPENGDTQAEGEDFIDLITGFGNGVGAVDDDWVRHARTGEVVGMTVKICPPEEIIWGGSYIMERERFDGAEVAHLLHAQGKTLDWQRLVRRFGDTWRVLFAHLLLYGFIYPGKQEEIPAWVMEELARRLDHENRHGPQEHPRLCRGTLVSGKQYLYDVEQLGYEDARPEHARQVPDTNYVPPEEPPAS